MKNFFAHFKVLWSFALHMLTAICVFALVAGGVVVLHNIVEWMAASGVNFVMTCAATALEWLLFACDVIATAAWAKTSTVRLIDEMKEK